MISNRPVLTIDNVPPSTSQLEDALQLGAALHVTSMCGEEPWKWLEPHLHKIRRFNLAVGVSIPSALLTQMTSIVELDLYGLAKGNLDLGGLRFLESLSVTWQGSMGKLSSVAELPLRRLRIENPPEDDGSSFENLPLEELELTACRRECRLPKSFKARDKLRSLTVHGAKNFDIAPLGSVERLHRLKLHSIKHVRGLKQAVTTNSSSLRWVEIENCKTVDNIDSLEVTRLDFLTIVGPALPVPKAMLADFKHLASEFRAPGHTL